MISRTAPGSNPVISLTAPADRGSPETKRSDSTTLILSASEEAGIAAASYSPARASASSVPLSSSDIALCLQLLYLDVTEQLALPQRDLPALEQLQYRQERGYDLELGGAVRDQHAEFCLALGAHSLSHFHYPLRHGDPDGRDMVGGHVLGRPLDQQLHQRAGQVARLDALEGVGVERRVVLLHLARPGHEPAVLGVGVGQPVRGV